MYRMSGLAQASKIIHKSSYCMLRGKWIVLFYVAGYSGDSCRHGYDGWACDRWGALPGEYKWIGVNVPLLSHHTWEPPGTHSNNHFSFTIQIWWKLQFVLMRIPMKWLQQKRHSCRGMCKMLLLTDDKNWCYQEQNFHRSSLSINSANHKWKG